jgi:hypothetical protein
MKKMMTQAMKAEKAWANRSDANIPNSPEVKDYNQALVSRMPEWREEQIRIAHAALMRERHPPRPLKRWPRGPVQHPVRLGDLG